MNTGRINRSLSLVPKIEISWPWLLGFIEGDGSFSTNGFYPRFFIDLTSSEYDLLLAINKFLNAGRVFIKDIPQSRLKTCQKAIASFSIQSIDFFYSYFIPSSFAAQSQKKIRLFRLIYYS